MRINILRPRVALVVHTEADLPGPLDPRAELQRHRDRHVGERHLGFRLLQSRELEIGTPRFPSAGGVQAWEIWYL